MNRIRETARQWAAAEGVERGWVVVHRGQAAGWTAKLNHPESWVPGCEAVSVVDGSIHRSRGGDDERGAERWEQVVGPSVEGVK